MVMEPSAVVNLNALSPMVVTELGMTKSSDSLLSWNSCELMTFNVLGRVTCYRLVHAWKP